MRLNAGRFAINQILLADDTALVADSEEELCLLVSEFGRVCECGQSKVIRCSRYVNMDRMEMRLIGEPLKGVDCFKYLGSQVSEDGGCARDTLHRMNEEHKA